MEVLIDQAAFTPVSALLGGVLIGVATLLTLWTLGRLAGISQIAHRAASGPEPGEPLEAWVWRPGFVLGLVAGGWLCSVLWPAPTPAFTVPTWALAAGGLLVGWGTVQGRGCTSGHGVCGLGRRSVRSVAATAVFMVAGGLTVWVVRHVVQGA